MILKIQNLGWYFYSLEEGGASAWVELETQYYVTTYKGKESERVDINTHTYMGVV